MSGKIWMIWGSPRTPDRLLELLGSRVQQSKVFRTMIGACGPYNLGGSTTPMMLQLADLMVRYLTGIAEDISVKIQDCYIPVDFVVLNMEVIKESTHILG